MKLLRQKGNFLIGGDHAGGPASLAVRPVAAAGFTTDFAALREETGLPALTLEPVEDAAAALSRAAGFAPGLASVLMSKKPSDVKAFREGARSPFLWLNPVSPAFAPESLAGPSDFRLGRRIMG